jgi:hypothetical protein
MLTFTDSIQINIPPEKVFDWFLNMDKNFVNWHPNHTKYTLLSGDMNVGDTIHFEEKIDDKWFKFNVKITKIQKSQTDWIIEIQTPPFATLAFSPKECTNGCVFTHTETYGFIKSKNPFINIYIIPCLKKVLNPVYRFDLIEKDIVEDNKRLRQILENSHS